VDVLLEALLDQIQALLVDIGYAARARLLDHLEEYQMEAVIPPKSRRKQPWEFDRDKYRWRHLIENLFAKLKQYRGIAARYDKRACTFLGAIHWAAGAIFAKIMKDPIVNGPLY
jgi:transposase